MASRNQPRSLCSCGTTADRYERRRDRSLRKETARLQHRPKTSDVRKCASAEVRSAQVRRCASARVLRCASAQVPKCRRACSGSRAGNFLGALAHLCTWARRHVALGHLRTCALAHLRTCCNWVVQVFTEQASHPRSCRTDTAGVRPLHMRRGRARGRRRRRRASAAMTSADGSWSAAHRSPESGSQDR